MTQSNDSRLRVVCDKLGNKLLVCDKIMIPLDTIKAYYPNVDSQFATIVTSWSIINVESDQFTSLIQQEILNTLISTKDDEIKTQPSVIDDNSIASEIEHSLSFNDSGISIACLSIKSKKSNQILFSINGFLSDHCDLVKQLSEFKSSANKSMAFGFRERDNDEHRCGMRMTFDKIDNNVLKVSMKKTSGMRPDIVANFLVSINDLDKI